jgi:hypothetical protein
MDLGKSHFAFKQGGKDPSQRRQKQDNKASSPGKPKTLEQSGKKPTEKLTDLMRKLSSKQNVNADKSTKRSLERQGTSSDVREVTSESFNDTAYKTTGNLVNFQNSVSPKKLRLNNDSAIEAAESKKKSKTLIRHHSPSISKLSSQRDSPKRFYELPQLGDLK